MPMDGTNERSPIGKSEQENTINKCIYHALVEQGFVLLDLQVGILEMHGNFMA
jgi:hypothetical protein